MKAVLVVVLLFVCCCGGVDSPHTWYRPFLDGEPCGGKMCKDGTVCILITDEETGESRNACLNECSDSDDCQEGWICQPLEGESGGVCDVPSTVDAT